MCELRQSGRSHRLEENTRLCKRGRNSRAHRRPRPIVRAKYWTDIFTEVRTNIWTNRWAKVLTKRGVDMCVNFGTDMFSNAWMNFWAENFRLANFRPNRNGCEWVAAKDI